MRFKTADLCDEFGDEVQVMDPVLGDFGGKTTFGGPVVTVDVFNDYALVQQQLEQPGEGRVLVADGGGSLLTALLGADLAALAQENDWAGIVIHGCIRDAEEIAQMPLGVKALATTPRRGREQGRGTVDRPVHFAGVTCRSGQYLYADMDGIVVADRDLLAPAVQGEHSHADDAQAEASQASQTEDGQATQPEDSQASQAEASQASQPESSQASQPDQTENS